MLNMKAAPASTSVPNTSSACQFPASVLVQEQREGSRLLLHLMKEDKISQEDASNAKSRYLCVSSVSKGAASSRNKESESIDAGQYMNDFQPQMVQQPESEYNPSLSMTESVATETEKVEPHTMISVAEKALSASREAVSLAKNYADLGDSLNLSLANVLVEEERKVRSTRLLERRSRRRVRNPKVAFDETNISDGPGAQGRTSETIYQNDPLKLFLSCADTELLTAKEECALIEKMQGLVKLEEVKSRLQVQFLCEPTLVEWAEAVGLSCQALQSELHSGKRSREKLIYANFRMVVHIAKQYQGRGLSLPDLLQEGSMGFTRSVEKFKPQAGCRFGTYAFWWIRQAIRKALFHHSRTIRLPKSIYGLLSKVKEAKRLCVQRGRHQPTKEEIVACAGITVEKLEKLLFITRMPLSIQQPVWTDQETTFQEITADNSIEVPDMSIAKQLMRQHVRSVLNVLILRRGK